MNEKIIILIGIFIIKDKTETKAFNTTEVKIKELEDQKDGLYNTINEAIDDTVNSLKQYNHSDALLTLNHMKELKKQIKLLNETEDNENVPEEIFEGSLTDVATKKEDNASVRRYAAIVNDKNNQIKLELKEILDLLKNQDKRLVTGEKKIEMDENRKRIEEKLQMWIRQRQLEKERIQKMTENEMKAYKMRRLEKCPAEGKEKKKKNTKLFRRKGSKKKRNLKVYPCCRKCCKRSDMGCL